MEITLEKIELVKDRTGVTYAEAKQALEEAEGSVVDAIIAIEETINAGQKSRGFGKKGEALFDRIKALIKKGNVSRIQVKKDGELVLNVPVNAGLVGVVIAPIAAVVGVVAAFGFKCVIEVIKDDGTIIDVSDAVSDAVGNVTEKSSTFVGTVKEKGSGLYEKGKEKAEDLKEKGKEKAEDLKEKAEDIYENAKEKAEDAVEKIKKDKDDEEFDLSECFAEEDDDDDDIEISIETEDKNND